MLAGAARLQTPEFVLQLPGRHAPLMDTTQQIIARQMIATRTRLARVDSSRLLAPATRTTKATEEHVLSSQSWMNAPMALMSATRTLPVLTHEQATIALAIRAGKIPDFKPPTEGIASLRTLAATVLTSPFRTT